MPVVDLRDVVKSYGGLRPFRLRALAVDAGEIVVLSGPDQPAAAVLTDLVTGTTLPDAGRVVVCGRSTAELAGHDDWLAFLEPIGIVNDRVVLLDELPVAANLAVPLTLDLDPMPPDARRTVEVLGDELGIERAVLDRPLAEAGPLVRWLVAFGRAVVHDPSIVLIEHPTVALHDAAAVDAAADAVRRAASRRRAGVLVVSGDRRFAGRAATRRVEWQAASGEVREVAGWRRWFR